MTIQSHANRYQKGKRDAIMGLPRDPGVILTYSYRQGYKKGLEKLKRDKKPVGPDRNPMASCAVCGADKRETEFDVYEVATDSFFCTDEERMSL